MAILVQHSFTGANSNTGLPNADTGQSTEVLAGIWGIENNQAYWVNGNPALFAWQANEANVQISLENIVASNVWSGALAFRISDASNYLLFRYSGTAFQLYKFVGGTATLISSLTESLGIGTKIFKVIANGSSIECYVNDVLKISVTETHNQAATKHGLRQHITSTTRYDNFLVESLETTPTVTPITSGTASLSAQSNLSANGRRAVLGTAAMSGLASLSAQGIRVLSANAVFTATSSLTARGHSVTTGNNNDLVPIGFISIQTNVGIVDLPVYNPSDVSYSALRIALPNSVVGCFDLVSDPTLPVKIHTPRGTMGVKGVK